MQIPGDALPLFILRLQQASGKLSQSLIILAQRLISLEKLGYIGGHHAYRTMLRLVVIRQGAKSETQRTIASLQAAKTDFAFGRFAKPLVDQKPQLFLFAGLQLAIDGEAQELFRGDTHDFREARVRVKDRA